MTLVGGPSTSAHGQGRAYRLFGMGADPARKLRGLLSALRAQRANFDVDVLSK